MLNAAKIRRSGEREQFAKNRRRSGRADRCRFRRHGSDPHRRAPQDTPAIQQQDVTSVIVKSQCCANAKRASGTAPRPGERGSRSKTAAHQKTQIRNHGRGEDYRKDCRGLRCAASRPPTACGVVTGPMRIAQRQLPAHLHLTTAVRRRCLWLSRQLDR